MSDAAETLERAEQRSAAKRLWVLLPLAGFLALAILFAIRLNAGDPSRIPSALLNKPLPEFSLPSIEEGGAGLSSADLSKGVYVLNIWGSWCGPCRLEHPLLMRLAAGWMRCSRASNENTLPSDTTISPSSTNDFD